MVETPQQTGPLKHLTIVEFGHFIAAPFATRVLADLGAEIIKIEPPGGDPVRTWGAQVDGHSLWWSIHGRNKKLVTLNLKAPKARALALKLVAGADAVVENFRPGQMEKFGLGPSDLASVRPGCVVVRISGFGQTGPRCNEASFGMIGEALGGIRHLTGYPPGETDLPPVRTGVSLGDSVAGLYGAIGLLAALLEQRNRPTGTPARVVDVALTESVLSLLEGILPEYGTLGRVRQPTGARIVTAAPSSAYHCADGAWIVIGANSGPLFARLSSLIGRPDLPNDPRFADNPARVANAERLDALITKWTLSGSSAERLAALQAADIPSAKIYTAADIAADPHYRARNAVLDIDDPTLDAEVLHPGPVPRFSGGPDSGVAWPGARVGAHNAEIYQGRLGISDADFADMIETGTI